MIGQHGLLVTLVELVDRLPTPQAPEKRRPGRPRVYTDRLFLKALVIMIVRHLHTVTELLRACWPNRPPRCERFASCSKRMVSPLRAERSRGASRRCPTLCPPR
jgi:hypothetical protein